MCAIAITVFLLINMLGIDRLTRNMYYGASDNITFYFIYLSWFLITGYLMWRGLGVVLNPYGG